MFNILKKRMLQAGADKIRKQLKEEILLDKDIDKLMHQFIGAHRNFFKSNPKKFTPMIMVGGLDRDEKLVKSIIGTDFPEGIDKAVIFNNIGKSFAGKELGIKPIFVMWAAEVWVGKDKKVAPSQDKNRVEAIFSTLLSADGRHMTASQKIKNGRVLGRAYYGKIINTPEEKVYDRLTPEFFRGWAGYSLKSLKK